MTTNPGPADHRYHGEFPGWCTCEFWCETEADYHQHVGIAPPPSAWALEYMRQTPESATYVPRAPSPPSAANPQADQ